MSYPTQRHEPACFRLVSSFWAMLNPLWYDTSVIVAKCYDSAESVVLGLCSMTRLSYPLGSLQQKELRLSYASAGTLGAYSLGMKTTNNNAATATVTVCFADCGPCDCPRCQDWAATHAGPKPAAISVDDIAIVLPRRRAR
jgi:hypothetical protein